MIYRFLVFLFFTFIATQIAAQGYLMLAGGGSESQGGWSDEPYKWVVNHATNKRIAIISYNTDETEWIPNYFKSLGAAAAKNFSIPDKTTANKHELYDSLITYNGIFIKGGDQWNYYNYYKGTKTQEALQQIFDQGGVLSGTSAGTMILSPIIFTAQIASVDPAVAIAKAYSNQLTLADDFLKTIPENYIFDTHFIERGRFGRLAAFMTSWFKKQGELTTGIGIDDHTALCIDKNGTGTVYGTGSVGFFKLLDTIQPFDVNATMLKSERMQFSQAIHGCTVEMKNFAINGLTNTAKPIIDEENERLRIFICGTDYPSDQAYSYLVNEVGKKNDPILIATGTNLTLATTAKSKLESNGAVTVEIIQAIASNASNLTIQASINQAKKMVIIDNEYDAFMSFINTPGNGPLLNESLHEEGLASFFVGDNARFPGKTVIGKYKDAGFASYHGELEFLPGLGIFKTTAIMPNTFVNPDYYENTVSGLTYALMADSLKFGLYITGSTFAEYHFTDNNQLYFKNISGTSPLIFLQNNGAKTDFVSQGPYAKSRNIVGFESLELQFLGEADTVNVGHYAPVSINSSKDHPSIKIFPNPASDLLIIKGNATNYMVQFFDLSGRLCITKEFSLETEILLKDIKNGLYFLSLMDIENGLKYSSKVCIHH